MSETESNHGNIKFDPEMCGMLIDWMTQGYSYGTWGVDPYEDGSFSVARSTLYEWEKTYPEWKVAKEKGLSAAQKFFEDLLRSVALGVTPKELTKLNSTGVNLSAVIFTLKTRFHEEYSEKNVVDYTSSDGSIAVSFVKPEKIEEKHLSGEPVDDDDKSDLPF